MQMTQKVDRPSEAAAILGVSKSTLARWSKNIPNFPQKIQLGGGRAVGYDHAEIIAFIEKRKEESQQ